MNLENRVQIFKTKVEKTSNMYILGTECPHLHFKSWKDYPVLATMSTRIGGVSQNEYSHMNLSFARGDAEKNVFTNFNIISNELRFDISDIIMGKQEHTTNVRYVCSKDKQGFDIKNSRYEDTDGFITDDPGVVLATSHADCVPIYIYDENSRTIAMLHAGWKGSLNNILNKALNMMTDVRKNIKIGIGASISQNNYEVGEELAQKVKEKFDNKEIQSILKPYNGKYLLDLWQVNKLNALYSGINDKNITISNLCTYENQEFLFSHRYTNGKRGNMLAFMKINM